MWGLPQCSSVPLRLLPTPRKRKRAALPASNLLIVAPGVAELPTDAAAPIDATAATTDAAPAAAPAAATDAAISAAERPAQSAAATAKRPPPPPTTGAELHEEVVGWLARRRLPVPSAIGSLDVRGASAAAHAAALCLALAPSQPELRERERRALVRFAEQRAAAAAAPPPSAGHDSSTDEDEDEAALAARVPTVEGGAWPDSLTFATEYTWADSVPADALQRYRHAGAPPRPLRPSRRVRVRLIRDPSHPAFNPAAGQCGLFARRPLPRGAWVLDYTGVVTAGGAEDRASDYVSDFGEAGELALDAGRVGNEARFVNDYRNTGRRPNVEFRTRRDRWGALRQGVYVSAKEGVAAGEELLINYGKPFWRARVAGSLEAFVKVRPTNQPK